MNKKWLSNVVFLFVLAGIFAFYYIRYKTAPDIESRRIVFQTENGLDSLENHRGDNIILMFYASWCGPCLREINDLSGMYYKVLDRDLKIIAVTDDPEDKIELVKNRFNPPFPLYKLEESLESIGVYTIPTVYVLNKRGKVVFEHVDILDWKNPSTLESISKHISS